MHAVIFLLVSSVFFLFSSSLNAMDQKPKKPASHKRHSSSHIEKKPHIDKKKQEPKSKEETPHKRQTAPTPMSVSPKDLVETIKNDIQSSEMAQRTSLTISSLINQIKDDPQSPHITSETIPTTIVPLTPSVDSEIKDDFQSSAKTRKKRSKKTKLASSDVSSGTSLKKSSSKKVDTKKVNKRKEELQTHTMLTSASSRDLQNLETTKVDSETPAASPTPRAHSDSIHLELLYQDLQPSPATSPRKKSKKSKLASSDISQDISLKKSFSIRNDDSYLQKAVIKGNKKSLKTIDAFLKNTSDPNQQSIGPQNTLLHIAVFYFYKHHNLKLINLFVKNHNVNSLIKNIYERAPYQCIDAIQKERFPELYKTLMLRATLDRVIDALLMTDPEIIATCFDENNVVKDNTKLVKKLFIIRERLAKILPDYAVATFMTKMIQSRLKYNRSIIKNLMRKYNKIPNYQDEWGNGLIHHLVYLRDEERLKILLSNPHIISIIKNSEHLLPSQLIDPSEKSELPRLLFARASVETYLERKAFSFSQQKITQLEATDENFTSMVTKIQEYFKVIRIAQTEVDRKLPESVALPQYINDPVFLLQHCNVLLEKYQTTHSMESDFKKHFIHIDKEKDTDLLLFNLRVRGAYQELMAESEESIEQLIKVSPRSTSLELKAPESPGLSKELLQSYGLIDSPRTK